MRPCSRILAAFAFLAIGAFVGTAQADSLHCESQAESAGHVAIEERGYELFVNPGAQGLSQVRLRITYFNSSSKALDFVARLALPGASQLEGLKVQGEEDWVVGGQSAKDPQGQKHPGVYAKALEKMQDAQLSAFEVRGSAIPPQSYTSVELVFSVPVERFMSRESLCFPARMLRGPGLAGQRRFSLRDATGKAQSFWLDDVSNQGQASVSAPSARESCMSWSAPAASRARLDLHIPHFAPGKGSSRFALSMALGQEKMRKAQKISVMLDNSTSLSKESFELGLRLERSIVTLRKHKGELWLFDRSARRLASSSVASNYPRRAGSDLVSAIQSWIDAGGGRSTREQLVVISDGLLPLPAGSQALRKLRDSLRKRPKASVLIVIDDPVLGRQGMSADHPLLDLAASIGAQLNLRSLTTLQDAQGKFAPARLEALLGSPRVAHKLDLSLPHGCVLSHALPPYLIAGQPLRAEVLCNRAKRSVWARLKVRQGSKTRQAKASATAPRNAISTWAAARSASELQAAKAAGYPTLPWFARAMQHESELSFAAAGRVREFRGRLDAPLLRHMLREQLWPRAHACYNHALSHNRKQAGVVQLAIALGKGEVSLVEASSQSLTIRDPAFLTCLEEAAWKMRVPSGLRDPRVYRVFYPLAFHPPKNAGAAEISSEDRLRFEWLMGRSVAGSL